MFARRPRLRTFGYVGNYRYFLTFCTHDRRSAFADVDVVTMVWVQILAAARQHGFEVIAYIFMPDHVHLFVEGLEESSDVKAFASVAKQKSAYAYARDGRGRLWQPSYYDRVLREEEGTPTVIRYVLQNPVAAKLAASHRDYPFIGSSRYTIEDLEDRARDAEVWQP